MSCPKVYEYTGSIKLTRLVLREISEHVVEKYSIVFVNINVYDSIVEYEVLKN